jgi:Cys-rich repeat protein
MTAAWIPRGGWKSGCVAAIAAVALSACGVDSGPRGPGGGASGEGLEPCPDGAKPTRKLTFTGPARVSVRPGEAVDFGVMLVEPGSESGFVGGATVSAGIPQAAGEAMLVPGNALTTDADGVAQVTVHVGQQPRVFQVRFASEGACSLSATVDVERVVKQLFVVGSPARSAFVRERLPIQVRAADDRGQPLQGESIRFEIRGANTGGATLDPVEGSTALDGSLSATFFTGEARATYAIRAIHAEAGAVDFQVRVDPATGGAACRSNLDCAPGFYCDDGTCTQTPVGVPGGGGGGVLLECPRDENSPCVLDAQCPAGQFCDSGTCRDRPPGACATRLECAKGYSCVNGQCVPDFVGGTGGQDDRSCLVNRDCDRHAPGLLCFDGVCLPENGCNADAQCPPGNVCRAPNCVPELECLFDAACGDGRFCDGAHCALIPANENARPIDVSGRWRTEHTFDLTDALLGLAGIGNILDTINQILQGNIGQLLGLPSIIHGPVNRAFQRIIDRFVPPWIPRIVNALNNVAHLFTTVRTRGEMDVTYVNNCDRVTGSEEWDTIIVMWIEQCPAGRRDPNFPDCAAMSLDTQRGDIRVEARELSPFAGLVSGHTLSLSQRKFRVEFFRIIEWAVNTVIQIATGHENVEELIEDIIDCPAIHDALNDSVGDWLCDTFDFCEELPFEDFCEAFKEPLAQEIAMRLAGIGIEATLMEFSGYATIVDDCTSRGCPEQPRGRELINGVWEGDVDVVFSGDLEGTWRAKR